MSERYNPMWDLPPIFTSSPTVTPLAEPCQARCCRGRRRLLAVVCRLRGAHVLAVASSPWCARCGNAR